MLSLLAISRADGWAVVKDSDGLLLVHPPYRASNQRRVAESFLTEAILRHGFVHPEGAQDFPGWQPLIQHLNSEVAQARRTLGQNLDDPELGEKLIYLLPESVLLGFVDRARAEQLPDPTAWPAAESLAVAILRAPQARTSTELRNSARDLLDELARARSHRERLFTQPSSDARPGVALTDELMEADNGYRLAWRGLRVPGFGVLARVRVELVAVAVPRARFRKRSQLRTLRFRRERGSRAR